MATSTTSSFPKSRLEDVLEHLPLGYKVDFKQRQIIYGPELPSHSIYLVVTGTVLVSQTTAKGSEVLLEISRPEELFGVSNFLDLPRSEKAVAFERSTVMSWPISDLEDLVIRRPRLGVALLQVLAMRNAEFSRRIESFATETIERRLARSLLRFSERLGQPAERGAVRMMPFTHETLARYVGTSREIITQYMGRFRRRGYLEYSRHSITVHAESLTAALNPD